MKLLMGIDPGLSGAIAFLKGSDVACFDMPTLEVIKNKKKRREVNGPELARLIKQWSPDFAVIELVGAMPGNGSSSMFNFGRSFGTAEGIISAYMIPVKKVRPAIWKKDFSLSKDKGESRRMATEIWPLAAEQFKRVKDDGRAEAALLAKWGEDYV